MIILIHEQGNQKEVITLIDEEQGIHTLVITLIDGINTLVISLIDEQGIHNE